MSLRSSLSPRLRLVLLFGSSLLVAFTVSTSGSGAEQWTNLAASNPPPARFNHTLVSDSANDRAIMFGGAAACGPLNDVWVLTNAGGLTGPAAWSQLAPTGTGPDARWVANAVYDAASNRMIVFGGAAGGYCSGAPPLRNDVWVLTNANGLGGTPAWIQLSPIGSPPAARGSSTSVYDPSSNRLIVFGGNRNIGNCGFESNDTWILTFANGLGGTPQWINANPGGAPPTARFEHVAVYDASANEMIVFGGQNSCGGTFYADAWALVNANGVTGTPAWVSLGNAPSVQSSDTAVLDAAQHRMLTFGGSTPGLTNGVRAMSNTNTTTGQTWSSLTPTGTPPSPRYSHRAVFDDVRRSMIVFGGNNGSVMLNDTWVLNLAAATTLTMPAATGTFGGTTTLQATLSASGVPVAGMPVAFSLSGVGVGSATTGGDGVATLNNVSLSGPNVGVYAGAVGASFAGTASYQTSSTTADLTINRAPASISVTGGGTFPYDGSAHVASGLVTGVFSESLGAASITYTALSNASTSAAAPIDAGSYRVNASFAGNTNYLDGLNGSIAVTITQASTTTSVALSASPSVFGQSVTFTATVAVVSPGAGTPTGTVTFKDGATTLGTGTLGAGTATLTTSSLSVASHSITASYGGDANFTASTAQSPVWQQLSPTGTGPDLNSQQFVSDGQGNLIMFGGCGPTGCNGSTSTFALRDAFGVNGTTQWVQIPTAGGNPGARHAHVLAYDAMLNELIVSGGCAGGCFPVADSTWKLTNGNGLGAGTPTWSQVMTPAPPANGFIVGQLAAVDSAHNALMIFGGQNGGGSACSTTGATESVNTSTFSWALVPTSGGPPGAQYLATGGYDPGSNRLILSNGWGCGLFNELWILTHANGKDTGFTPTWMKLLNQGAAGSPAGGPAWGRASYSPARNTMFLVDGGSPSMPNLWRLSNANGLGASGLAATPVWTLASTTGGPTGASGVGGIAYDAASDRIVAQLNVGNSVQYWIITGASVSGASTSQIVTQASTTTSVTSSANPSVSGQSVNFTATVSAVAPGSGTPSGTVTFKDGSTTLGTGTLSGGTATFATSSLAVASHSITTVYGGDTNFTASTSSTLTQTVNKASTTTSVASSVNPSVFGQSVTFTATVAVVSPGAGAPFGAVTFTDGATTLGTGTLGGGTATLTTSALTGGNRVITASYGSDGNYSGSAGTVNQSVTDHVYLVAVTPSTPSINVGGTQAFTATGTYLSGATTVLRTVDAWTSGAGLSQVSYGLGAAVVNGQLYAISGYFTPRVARYNPATNTWTDLANLPGSPLQYFGTAVIGTRIYVVGGDKGGSGQVATLYAYETTTDSWITSLPSMPGGARYSLSAAALNGKLYAVGGVDSAGQYLTRVEVYDPAANSWSTLGTGLSVARVGPAVGAIGGRLFAAGGGTPGGAVGTLDVYDPVTNAWTIRASMPNPRDNPGAVADGQLWVVGSGPSPENQVHSYNPATNTWTQHANLPTGRHALGVAADEASGRVFAVGGYNSGFQSALEILQPLQATWSTGTPGVASITTAGVATGVASGTSVITATTLDGVSSNTTLTVIDTTPPTTTATPSPAANAAAWNKTNVTVTLNATDNAGGSGVQSITYSLNGQQSSGATIPGNTASVPLLFVDGTTTVKYYATDNSGNVEPEHALSIRIDKTAPFLSYPFNVTTQAMSSAGATVTFSVSGSDSLSGLAGPVTISPFGSGGTFPIGITHETVSAADIAGNTAIATFDVVVNPARPNVVVSGGTFTADGNSHPATATAKDSSTNAPVAGGFTFVYAPGGASAPVAAGRYSATATFTSGDPAYLSAFPWTTMAPDPNAKVAPAVVGINGRLYVQGFDQDALGNQSSFVPRLSIYDTFSNTWTVGASPAIIRAFANAVAINGKLYVLGGCVMSDCRIGTTNALEIYDPATNAWSNGASMVTARFGAAAGVIGGKLYVAGGDTACPPCVATNTTEIYDPATNTWTAGAPIPAARELAMGAVVNGRLYVIGGSAGAATLDRVDVYDPAANSWTSAASMPVARHGAAVGVINGRIHVVGGGSGSVYLAVNESYDPGSDTWTEQAPMSIARTYLSGGVVNQKLYVVDGFNAVQLSANEAFDANLTTVITINPGDTTPPTTTANAGSSNTNGWYKFNVNVNLNANDSGGAASPSGVQSITYSLSGSQTGGGTFNTSSTSFNIFNEGTTTVTYHATDNRGNVELDKTLVAKLDKTSPSAANLGSITVNATSSAGAVVTFDLAPSDSLSGVDTVVRTQGLASGSTFPHGTTSEAFTITDKAGNNTFRNFSVTVNKTLLSIAVSPLTASVNVGSGQSFQATGHFTSGSDQTMPTSGGSGGGGSGGSGGGTTVPVGATWQLDFTSLLNINACPGGMGYSSQGVSPNSSGMVSTSWGNPAEVQVSGTVMPPTAPAPQVNLTLTCVQGGATGSIVASWTGTRYEGTATLGGPTSSVSIVGWSTKADLLPARFSFGAATVNGIVYAMGGGNPSQPQSVQAYNPATNSWSTVSQMPTPLSGAAVAALNNKIYVVGGGVSGGVPTTLVQVYDPAANTWTTLAPMLTARAHLAVVAAGGRIYAIGGDTASNNVGVMATVESYDPLTNQWTARASMISPRSFHTAGALNGDTMIVVAGGSNNGTSTELYDVATNIWTAGPAMLTSTGGIAGAVVNNAFFVFGGSGSGGAGLTLAHMFRPAGNGQPAGWAAMASMPTGRNELAAAAVGDVVYAIGGQSNNVSLATVEAFHTPPPFDFSVSSGGSSGGGGGGGSSLPTVSWQSTNTAIAGINSSGFATGNAPGQTTIVATASVNGSTVSCATTGTCATLTVSSPVFITLTLAPGSVVFPSVQVTVVTDHTEGQFDVPFGQPNDDEPGLIRLMFTAPVGYTVTPAQVDLDLHAGDSIYVPLFFALIDTTPPVLTASSDLTVEATSSAGAGVTFAAATATDAGSGVASVSCDRASGDTFAIGVTTVHCSATDNTGNTANASFTVTVKDTAPPVWSGCSLDALWHADNVSIVCRAEDLVGIQNPADASFTLTTSVAAGTETAAAVTNSHQICDTSGNCVTGGPVGPIKIDRKAPALVVSPNKVVEATSLSGAFVSFAAPTATDNGSGVASVSCNRAPGQYSIGVISVSCSAVDAVGNTANGGFTATVQDTTAPIVQFFNLTADTVLPTGGTLQVQVDVTEAVRTNFVIVNNVYAFQIGQPTPTTGRYMAFVQVPPSGAFTLTASAFDLFGHRGDATLVFDNDGIEAAIDRNRSTGVDESNVYSSEFNWNGTVGTITRNAAVVQATRADANTVRVALLYGYNPYVIVNLCTGANKYIVLTQLGSAANVTCAPEGTVTLTGSGVGVIELYKQITQTVYTTYNRCETRGGFFSRYTYCYTVQVPYTYTYWSHFYVSPGQTFSTGSPMTASPDNTEPIQGSLVQIDDNGTETPVADILLDPGESIDVSVQQGLNREDRLTFTGLLGSIQISIDGTTQTVDQGSQTLVGLDFTPPVLTLPGNITTDATTTGGAAVTFSASANDAVDGARPVVCSPSSGATFAIGTTTVNCTAADTRGNMAAGSFTVTVRSASQIITGLVAQVAIDSFQQGSNLLQNMLKSIDSGNISAACGQLGAFTSQVQAQAGKKLTTTNAAALVSAATDARAALGCQ
jgi:N-acetylneuraminic acid mutarotase